MRGNVLVRCGEGLEETYAIKAQGAFILLHAVRCPHCQSDQIVKRGKTARGTQRYLCQNTLCPKGSFLLDLTFRTLFSRSMIVFEECALAKRGMVLSHPTRA